MPADPHTHHIERRHCLVALACGLAAAASTFASEAAWVAVWVDLDAPVAAGAPDAATARARHERVLAQQARVALELHALGGVELARVHHVRNTIAVRLPRTQLDVVRGIAGVVRVRPVQTLHPPETTPDPPR
jgi:hypothetical protein